MRAGEVEPFGERGQRAGGLDDDVRTGLAAQVQHRVLPLLGGRAAEVDGRGRAQPAGDLQPGGERVDGDDLAGARRPRGEDGGEADRTGALIELTGVPGLVAVRDSKDPEGPVLLVTASALRDAVRVALPRA
ncbi:hypothetical protein GCM10010191_02400 [Actinomadura vinacea]|uniref:DUF397 domain-containing protein n=1 Tax=Actinomadura vinacea TaxID=115336 RepID=A0ABP5VE61_9ACTN